MAKLLKDMTFEEYVDWAAWRVMHGLLRGDGLHSIIYEIVQAFAAFWNYDGRVKAKEPKK